MSDGFAIQALEQLDFDELVLVLWTDFYGLSHREAADQLTETIGWPTTRENVTRTLRRAHERMGRWISIREAEAA